MKKSGMVRILGIIGVLVLLFMNGYGAVPTMASEPNPANTEGINTVNNKVSSLLSMHIKMKTAQAANTVQDAMKPFGIEPESTGETTSVNRERVFLHFAQKPTDSQINELQSFGVTIYPDSWIPPVGSHPTGFLLADMPIDKLDALASRSYIVSLDSAEQTLSLQNDLARTAMNVDPVWAGGYTGAGITVAVIDSGIDTSNPDFPSLNTTNSKDYSNYPTLDDTITNTMTGHGTHVTGSLLGRGYDIATYKGVAPGANLVFIKVDNDTDGSASSAAVTYAIRDAVDVYHAQIINLSLGAWSIYHDGTDQASQAVDYATSKGTTVFAAAGNYASDGWHYSGIVNAGATTADIPITVASGATSYLGTDLVWYDGPGTHNGLSLQYYNSSHTLLNPAVSGQSESIKGTESNEYIFNTAVSAGTYYLKVQNNSLVNQFFHIYYTGGSTAVTFSSPDPNYTLGSPAEADSAIAVGAYVTSGPLDQL